MKMRNKSVTSRLLRKSMLSLIFRSSWRKSDKKAQYLRNFYRLLPSLLFVAVHFTTVLVSQCRVRGLWNRFKM